MKRLIALVLLLAFLCSCEAFLRPEPTATNPKPKAPAENVADGANAGAAGTPLAPFTELAVLLTSILATAYTTHKIKDVRSKKKAGG